MSEDYGSMFADGFKKLLAYFLNMVPGKIFGGFDGVKDIPFIGPIIWDLLQKNGLTDAVAKMRDKTTEAIATITATVNKDLAAATEKSTGAIQKLFSEHGATLLVNDKNAAALQEYVSTTVKQFFASDIPGLDKDSDLPAEAYKTAIAMRAQIVTKLSGKEGDTVVSNGFLPPALPGRDEEAERIATLITGIPAGGNLITVSATPPVNGIAAMLANIQKTRYTENFKEGDIKESNITLALDGNLLKPATLGNTKIASGKDVKETTPPAGSKPNDRQKT